MPNSPRYPTNKLTTKTKSKKSNIIDDAKNATTKGIKDISDTIEGGKKINDLLIRKSILLAEIAIRQNELNSIDRKIGDTLKKNPLNEFLLKITAQLEKVETKEIAEFLEALRPLGNLLDLSKILANQTSMEISNTIKSNVRAIPKKKK